MAGTVLPSGGSPAGDSRPSHLFRFGVYEVDPHNREIRREGLRIKLPEKSFQLLLILLENAGKVVLRGELQAACGQRARSSISMPTLRWCSIGSVSRLVIRPRIPFLSKPSQELASASSHR